MSTMPIMRAARSPRGSAHSTVVQLPSSSGNRLAQQLDRVAVLENRVVAAIRPFTLPGLRVALGMLFIWFGALKVAGASPVAAIVSGTLPFADPTLTVLVLGGVELVLGAALVFGVAVRLVLPVLAGHLTGTFLTFVMLPELMFRDGNPLLLTESGEFVVKNLVLIGATVVLMAHTRTEVRPPAPLQTPHSTGPEAA